MQRDLVDEINFIKNIKEINNNDEYKRANNFLDKYDIICEKINCNGKSDGGFEINDLRNIISKKIHNYEKYKKFGRRLFTSKNPHTKHHRDDSKNPILSLLDSDDYDHKSYDEINNNSIGGKRRKKSRRNKKRNQRNTRRRRRR
jgi:hypothetical protein